MPKGVASFCVANKKKGKSGKKDKVRMVYYNCVKAGHTTYECTKPNKIMLRPDLTMCLVSSTVPIAHSLCIWIVDFKAMNHIARDQDEFVEYCCISAGRKVYMGNDFSVDVLSISTYKLVKRGGSVLILCDVLYAEFIFCYFNTLFKLFNLF